VPGITEEDVVSGLGDLAWLVRDVRAAARETGIDHLILIPAV
jgi:hypothetical protein